MKLSRWLHRQFVVRLTHAVTVRHAGKAGRFHVRSKPEYKVIVGGLAEAPLRDAVFAQLRADDVIVEVGAHIGSWSVFLAQLVPQGQLYAFEPVPGNYEKLTANLKLNGLTRVTAYRKAVSDRCGTADFSLEDNDAPVQGTLLTHDHPAQCFSVELTTIDDLAATLDRGPTVLKIDCEGAEALVLRGAQQALSSSVRVVFLELHEKPLRAAGHDPEQLVQLLVDAGFQIQARWPETQHVLFVKPDLG